MPNLQGKIAVVTGASRGAGRGIAIALGEAGATVYVTGRSVRGANNWRTETINDTADEISRRGGIGIPVQVDHTDDGQAAALFDRVKNEYGRLNLLVNNAWGGHDPVGESTGKGFWERPADLWDKMFTAGVRASLMSSRFAVPLMLPQKQGLIVNTSFYYKRYDGFLYYDLAKNALNRLAHGMAGDLKPHGIAAVAVSPGWMRTELVLEAYGATEETWHNEPELTRTETPFYAGRAVAHLAADPHIMAKTGETLQVGDLAREYGFTDIDGRYIPPFDIDH